VFIFLQNPSKEKPAETSQKDKLISFEPSNLVAVRIEQGQKCYGVVTMRNVMYTMPVVFRLLPVNKNRYSVRPQTWIIAPLTTFTVEITYHLAPNGFLPDSLPYCNDGFQLLEFCE